MQHTEHPLDVAAQLAASHQPDAAAAVLAGYISSGHDSFPVRAAYARALAKAGDLKTALESAQQSVRKFPHLPAAAILLGELLMRADLLSSAIGELQRAMELDPQSNQVYFLLGSAWLLAGEAERALSFFAEVDEDTPGLADRIARAERMKARPRSDAAYVRHLFNYFSSSYESHMLTQLHYQAPVVIRGLFDMLMPGVSGLAILDLGCGTGLAGQAFQTVAARLTGVDLSPRMLDFARRRGVYQDLLLADMERPVVSPASFDLVLAADSLVYLGELDRVLTAVAHALRPGGHFLFSVERKDGTGYELGPKRRWRHSETYLRQMALAYGFDLVGLIDSAPRTENDMPVPGYAGAMKKVR